jgi:hypothetical protein
MKKQLLIIAFIFTAFHFFAQEMKMTWSQEVKMTKKTGFYNSILGRNDNLLYVKFSSYSKIRITAFDKMTMKEKFTVPVKGFPENKATKADFKGLDYYRTIIFSNSVYTFWIKESKEKDELFVQTYDANLKMTKPLRKIYELKSFKGAKKKAELFTMVNQSLGEKILIGGETAGNKGDNVKVEYKILNADFTFSNAGQAELPLQITGRSNSLSSSYSFGDDGNLHVKSDKSLTIVNLEKGTKETYIVEFKNKQIFDFDYIYDQNTIRVFGLFCDLTKDKSGNDNHGIFYAIINSATLKLESENFTYFTKEQLDKLFAEDQSDRKDNKLFQSKKSKDSEDQSLKTNYSVENVLKEGKDLILICSIMYNYTVTYTTTNSNGTTSTRQEPRCNKRNLTVFRINDKGEIKWATNVNRSITYPSHYVYDINSIKKDNTIYVTYGSDFISDKPEGNKKKKCCSSNIAAAKEMRDKIAYATFDLNSGVSAVKEIVVNQPKIPNKDRKIVDPTNIETLGGDFYIVSEKYNMRANSLIGLLFRTGKLQMGYTTINSGNSTPTKGK